MVTSKSPGNTTAQREKVMQAVYARFRDRPNFTGVDIGYKWEGTKCGKEICVRIHVERKLSESELAKDLIFPKKIDGVPIDVIQGPYRHSERDVNLARHVQQPYLMGGLSVARDTGGAGTCGAIVIDNQTGRPALLSNWHVLAGPDFRKGDPIVHPARQDAELHGSNQVGRLSRAILNLDGDAAIAELEVGQSWLPVQFETFQQINGLRQSRLGEKLTKTGRTTKTTQARVDGEGIYRLSYQVSPGVFETRDIQGFKLVHPDGASVGGGELSAPGDSGSLWFSEAKGEAVGLHFAGETDPNPLAEHAIACNIETVMDRLDCRFATFEDFLASQSVFPEHMSETTRQWDAPNLQRSRRGPVTDYPGSFDMDPRDWRPRFIGERNTIARSRAEVFPTPPYDLWDDIWMRLLQALEGHNPAFGDAKFHDLVRDVINASRPDLVLANVINESRAFADLVNPVPQFRATDFRPLGSFGHACEAIADIL